MRLTQSLRRGRDAAYGLYAWAALLAVVTPVSILLLMTRDIVRRRTIARRGARLVCRLTRTQIDVSGHAPPMTRPCIVVANHASYLDGIVLTAVLPPQFAFLIKSEMSNVPVAGFVLRRIAAEFVDRRDPRDRHRSARRLVRTARGGSMLAVFPEGTFEATPGLRPFRLGAFAAAARGQLPVVPIVIRGTRAKLPAGRLLPVPGGVSVHICPPIEADSAAALVDATRAAMLAELDEPDLEPPAVDYMRA